MVSAGKVVLVTGSNRGMGQGLARAIAAFDEPVHILAASRAGAADEGLKLSNPASSVEFVKVDYTNDGTISAVADHIRSNYGCLDVLINNGAAMPESKEGFTENAVKLTIGTNVRGVAKLTDTLLPLMPAGARVVHVSSSAAVQFNTSDPEVKAALTDPKLTRSVFDQLVDRYEADALVKNPKSGWVFEGFGPIYSMSKGFLNILTGVQARDRPDVLFNAVCPGMVDTEMNRGNGQTGMTIEQGIRIPLRLAFGEINGVSGKFWAAKTPRDTETMGAVHDDWMGKSLSEIMPDGDNSLLVG